MAKKKKKRRQQVIKVPTNCVFCNTDTKPDYKNHEDLGKYLTDRAKIIGKDRSGICSKHQRSLSTEIKRARHLGLLPFSPSM